MPASSTRIFSIRLEGNGAAANNFWPRTQELGTFSKPSLLRSFAALAASATSGSTGSRVTTPPQRQVTAPRRGNVGMRSSTQAVLVAGLVVHPADATRDVSRGLRHESTHACFTPVVHMNRRSPLQAELTLHQGHTPNACHSALTDGQSGAECSPRLSMKP